MTTHGSKNKRGARGSADEDLITPKRANMAATEDSLTTEDPTEMPTEDASDEPSRHELKEMLVDIQITMSSILLENKKICKEMADLKTFVEEQKAEIVNLKTSLAAARKEHDGMEKALKTAKNRIDDQQEEISELYDLQDSLEQYTRKNLVEIHGVPESAYTSTEEVVLKLAEAMEVIVQPQDIEISHKLHRKGNKPIIVKFQSHKVKSSLYKARVKLKNISVSSLFPQATYASSVQSGKIFLTESLTSYRRSIVNKANEKRKDGELLSVWTMDGKIYVKTSPQGRPLRINELDDLENI